MSTSELAAVEDLLVRVLPDPMGFAERILGELMERLATAPPGTAPTVVPGHASPVGEHAPNAASNAASFGQQAVVDRHVLLAAALGACECWGEAPACADCDGQGGPGWMPPDPELYAEYVAPAVRRTSDLPPDQPSSEGDQE